MRLGLLVLVLLILVSDAYLEEYKELPWERLMYKLAEVIKHTKENKGIVPAADRNTLNVLRKDITADCKVGKLKHYDGKPRNSLPKVADIKFKPYLLSVPNDISEQKVYWVLIEANCKYKDESTSVSEDEAYWIEPSTD